MQENRNDSELRLLVTGTRRDGRRRDDLHSKRPRARPGLQPARRRTSAPSRPGRPNRVPFPDAWTPRLFSIFSVVVFPAPLGPRNPTISFSRTSKERSDRTRTGLRQKPGGYDFVSPAMARIVS